MGFYTDFSVDLTLRSDTPTEVVDVIRYMVWENWEQDPRNEIIPPHLPDHALFRCERWHHFLSSTSHGNRKFDGLHLEIDSGSFKNYDDEIVKFTDWIAPYCVPQEKPILESENEANHQTRHYSNGRRFHRTEDPYGYYDERPSLIRDSEEELERTRWTEY